MKPEQMSYKELEAEVERLRKVEKTAKAVIDDGMQTPNVDEYNSDVVYGYDVDVVEFDALRAELEAKK